MGSRRRREGAPHGAGGWPASGLAAPRGPIACVRATGDPDALLAACLNLTPRVERHPTALVLDLGSCERLLCAEPRAPGGASWPELAAALRRRLEAAGARAGAAGPWLGLGPTRTTAWLAAEVARRGDSRARPPWRVLRPAEAARALRPLPLGALLALPDLVGGPAAPRALDALARGGVATLGQLARLPEGALRRRFGALGAALARLAAGGDLTPLRAYAPAEWVGLRLRLDPPAAPAQLRAALAPLARRLAEVLVARRQEASALELALRAEGRPAWRVARRLGQATASPAALLDHAHRLLAALDPPAAGIAYAAIHLRAGGLRAAGMRQEALWGGGAARARLATRARLLAGDGGPRAALLRAVPAAPWAVLPEERWHLEARR